MLQGILDERSLDVAKVRKLGVCLSEYRDFGEWGYRVFGIVGEDQEEQGPNRRTS
jgi:hypothetical protein